VKKLFAAAVVLAAAAVTAAAQAPDDKTIRIVTPEPSPRTVLCDPAPAGDDDCAPQTERAPPPTFHGRRPFLSAPAQDFAQTPAAGGHEPARAAAAQSVGTDKPSAAGSRFRWGDAVKQSLLFLSVQHGYALTQPKTRRDLRGPFFKDYFRSVRALHGWADGGRFFTNYVAHPLEGSLLGFIQVQNDPAGARLRFNEPGYWRSRMKALAWSAAWSTQFEIGPVSQASIGNVGLHGKQTYVDIVMTPTAGLGLLVAEDFLDRYVVGRLERRTDSKYARIFARMALNPTRTAANLLRFKKPWHRDDGLR
jgi:hypothetical protein